MYDFGFDYGNSVAKGTMFDVLNQPRYCGVPAVFAEGTLAALNNLRQAAGMGEYTLHNEDYALSHNGADLYLGRLAYLYSNDAQETRGVVSRYWGENALQFLLTISGSLIFDREYSLNLVTGLPAQTYDKLNRKRVRDALTGEHSFLLNGVRRRASVHVAGVIQEGAGGIPMYGTQQPVKQAVIDIGGRTTDIYTARGQEPIREQCAGRDYGVEDATDRLAEFAEARYGRVLTIAERRAILQCYALQMPFPDIALSGRSLPFDELANWAELSLRKTGGLIKSFVSKTLRSGEKGSVATDLRHCWIVGGGAHYFLSDIKEIISFAEVRPAPEFANALSYAYLARFFAEQSQARMTGA